MPPVTISCTRKAPRAHARLAPRPRRPSHPTARRYRRREITRPRRHRSCACRSGGQNLQRDACPEGLPPPPAPPRASKRSRLARRGTAEPARRAPWPGLRRATREENRRPGRTGGALLVRGASSQLVALDSIPPSTAAHLSAEREAPARRGGRARRLHRVARMRADIGITGLSDSGRHSRIAPPSARASPAPEEPTMLMSAS